MINKELLLCEQHGYVRVLTLNRPERHHALNFRLAQDIASAVELAENDDSVRVLVITGGGDKAFCAGQDMLEMSDMQSDENELKIAQQTTQGSPPSSSAAIAVDRIAKAKLPVIAAVNGICYGGGALLALACDIRLASTASTFRFPGAEYGLVVGAAWLPRLVGSSKAKELIFTARKFDAAEALSCGLLSYTYPADRLMRECMAMASAISQNSVVAVRESKRVIDAATLVAEANALERGINKTLRGSEEQTARFNQATTRVTGKNSDD